MKFKPYYIVLLVSLLIVTCKNDTKEDLSNQAFIGGEIVNPNSEYVYLLKSNTILDTIALDKKNRFKYKFTDLKPGLYDFFHGGEIQSFLLEPSDSIMFRLNTIEFDESLVYSGTGARENNFLINLFLENEEEEKIVLKLSQFTPDIFEKKLNELREDKLKRLAKFKLKYKPSDLFIEIAEASINYKHYSNKEFYPFANYSKSELDMFNSLPEDFYNYRSDVDYNNETLKYYRPYNTFLRFHINNLALRRHFEHSKDVFYNEHSVDYNLDRLNIIDEKIQNESIKNVLMYNTMIHFIDISKDTGDYDELLASFKEKSTNKKHINRAARIVNSYKRLKPGQKVPSLNLLDETNKVIPLKSLINRPTVLYFWSKESKGHIIDSHKRAKELEVKYPEVTFIAINTDSISYTEQSNILKRNDLRINNEYRFKFPKKSKEILSVKPINKVFLINKKRQIVNAKANMFNISFEQDLLGVINQTPNFKL